MQFLMRQGFGSSRARALGCGHWKSAWCLLDAGQFLNWVRLR
jgi:hypothetical protein